MDELGLRVARKVAVATSRRGFLGWIGKGAAAALGVATAGAFSAQTAAATPATKTCCAYSCLTPGGASNVKTRCVRFVSGVSDCPAPPAGCTLCGVALGPSNCGDTCKAALNFCFGG
jgi:hypothetical protein